MPLMRISNGGTDIDFQSLAGSTIPEDLNFVQHVSKNGTLWSARIFEIGQWFPVLWRTESDAANLNLWTRERRTCTFAPDQAGAPGTTHQVKILNRILPMQRISDDGPTYEGQLNLREVSP